MAKPVVLANRFSLLPDSGASKFVPKAQELCNVFNVGGIADWGDMHRGDFTKACELNLEKVGTGWVRF